MPYSNKPHFPPHGMILFRMFKYEYAGRSAGWWCSWFMNDHAPRQTHAGIAMKLTPFHFFISAAGGGGLGGFAEGIGTGQRRNVAWGETETGEEILG